MFKLNEPESTTHCTNNRVLFNLSGIGTTEEQNVNYTSPFDCTKWNELPISQLLQTSSCQLWATMTIVTEEASKVE